MYGSRWQRRLSTAAILTIFAAPAQAAFYYVQQSAGNDANPGDAWGAGHALATLGRALQLAAATPEADIVRVAAGTYAESLGVPGNISLLGGYPADGGTKRDRVANPTIVDGGGSATPFSVTYASNVLIDGFVIRNGLNQVQGYGMGGGIFIFNTSNVAIRDNLIRNNAAVVSGGGISVRDSVNVTLAANVIRDNRAPNGAGVDLSSTFSAIRFNVIQGNVATEWGGGLLGYGGALTLTGNLISDNQAHAGGGVALNESPNIELDANRLLGNRASGDGGGVLLYASQGNLRNNRIQGNRSGNWGGGICLRTRTQANLINNLVVQNVAGGNGGGVSLYEQTQAGLTNNTQSQNRARGLGGGLYLDSGTEATVTNGILWGNAAASVTPGDNTQITANGTLNVSYSDVAGGWAGTGNLDANPGWVLPGEDFHLAATSPCRDSGTAVGAPRRDLDGTLRPQGAGYDMGAYEWSPGPDIGGFWKSASLSPDGQTLTASFILRNQVPDQEAGAFRVAFYLSADGDLPVGQPFHTVKLADGLAGGAQQRLDIQHQFSGSVSGQYVLAVLDDQRAVRETVEKNNFKAVQPTSP